jgi:hypothetical protein
MSNLWKRTIAVFVILFAFIQTAPGQSLRAGAARGAQAKETGAPAKEPFDEVENLLDHYMVAQGGLALFQLKTRIVRGRVEMSESPLPGTFEVFEKMPGKSIMVVNAPSGQFLAASDGDRRWLQTPWGSTKTVAAVGGIKLLEQAASGKGFKWRNAFSSASLKGRAVVEGHETIVLAATPRDGKPLIIYFDAKTFLPRKIELARPAADGANHVKAAYFDSYATVDGVKVPAVIRQVYVDYTMTFRATEVRHNVPINDALFATPKGK